MKTILCVIDLTESSLDVLQFAATIAHAQKAYLSILFPYRLINQNYPDDAGKLRTKLEQQALSDFTAFKKQVPLLDTISFDFKPEIGFAGYIVKSFVQRKPVDMVVIGQTLAQNITEGNESSLTYLIQNLKVPFTIVPKEKIVDGELLAS